MTNTSIDAKTAARQRVQAFLQARNSYALSLGHSGFVPDEITRQIPDAGVTVFTGTFDRDVPIEPPAALTASPAFPLFASDLALLAADD